MISIIDSRDPYTVFVQPILSYSPIVYPSQFNSVQLVNFYPAIPIQFASSQGQAQSVRATLPQLAQMTVLPSIIQSQIVSAQQSQNGASVLLTPQLSLPSQVPLGSASYHASVSPQQVGVSSSTPQASVSSFAQQSSVNSSAQQAIVNSATQQLSASSSTPQTPMVSTSHQATVSSSTQQSSVHSSVQQVTINSSTKQPTMISTSQQTPIHASPKVDLFERSLSPLGKRINDTRKAVNKVFKAACAAHIFSQNCIDTINQYSQYCVALLPTDEKNALLYLETISEYLIRLITAYIAQVDVQLNKESAMEATNENTVRVLTELREWCLGMLIEEKKVERELGFIMQSISADAAKHASGKEGPPVGNAPIRPVEGSRSTPSSVVRAEKRPIARLPKVPPLSYTPKSSFVVPSRLCPRMPKHQAIATEEAKQTLPLMSVVFEMKEQKLARERCVARSLKRASWEMNGEIVTVRRSVRESVNEMREAVSRCSVDCACDAMW